MKPHIVDDRAKRIRDLTAQLENATGKERLATLNDLAAVLAPSAAAQATAYAREALTLAEELGEPRGAATARQCLAHACYCAGAYAEAITHAHAAVAAFEHDGARSAAARTLLVLAAVYVGQSRLSEAMESAEKALALATADEDSQAVAITHGTMAAIHTERGDMREAVEHHLRCAEIHERNNDRYRLAMAYINIGEAHARMGTTERAMRYYADAIAMLESSEPAGYPIAAAHHAVGDAHRALGAHAEARAAYERALAIRSQAGDECGCVASNVALGELALLESQHDVAERHLDEARIRARDLGMPKEDRLALLGLVQVHEARGEFETALRLMRRASALNEQLLEEMRADHASTLERRAEAERAEQAEAVRRLRDAELEREIGRREQAEQALMHSQKFELLGVMAGGVAHDFNNMLVAVLGYTEMAKELVAENSEARSLLDLAYQSGRRAADLAQQMLAYAGRRHYDMKPNDLSEVVHASMPLLAGLAGSRASVQVQEAPDLPAVPAERSQLVQILTNLVLNAMEAEATRIDIALEKVAIDLGDSRFWVYTGQVLAPGPYVLLRVRDDGTGMSEGVRRRAFDPFFTTRFTGRGLGLAAVLGIVRGHHAGLTLKSQTGEGTTLEIVFPVAATHAPAGPDAPRATETAESGHGSSVGPGASRLVLIVDDEPDVRQLARAMVESAGHRVLLAPDGKAAIEVLRANSEVEVILIDMAMPGLAIEETWRGLRALGPHAGIAFVSGYDRHEGAHRLDPDAPFLAKPFSRAELLSVIEAAASRAVRSPAPRA